MRRATTGSPMNARISAHCDGLVVVVRPEHALAVAVDRRRGGVRHDEEERDQQRQGGQPRAEPGAAVRPIGVACSAADLVARTRGPRAAARLGSDGRALVDGVAHLVADVGLETGPDPAGVRHDHGQQQDREDETHEDQAAQVGAQDAGDTERAGGRRHEVVGQGHAAAERQGERDVAALLHPRDRAGERVHDHVAGVAEHRDRDQRPGRPHRPGLAALAEGPAGTPAPERRRRRRPRGSSRRRHRGRSRCRCCRVWCRSRR